MFLTWIAITISVYIGEIWVLEIVDMRVSWIRDGMWDICYLQAWALGYWSGMAMWCDSVWVSVMVVTVTGMTRQRDGNGCLQVCLGMKCIQMKSNEVG